MGAMLMGGRFLERFNRGEASKNLDGESSVIQIDIRSWRSSKAGEISLVVANSGEWLRKSMVIESFHQ